MLNKVQVIGRLGGDPEVKTTNGGNTVCNMTVATSEKWKGKDGTMQEKTEWHRVIVWGPQATSCGQYLSKGKMVYVEGKVETRKWQGTDGVDKYTTEIIARDVKFLSARDETTTQSSAQEPSFDNNEELPF